jgi:hypothetical protein
MSSSLAGTTRVLREIYLSIFVAFFRVGHRNWSLEMNKYKGALGMSLFHGFLLMGGGAWAAYFTGTPPPDIPRLTFYVVFIAFYALHCYVFIRRQYGIAFEHAFKAFERRRQIHLLAAAWLLFAATWAFAIGSGRYVFTHTSLHQ